MAKVTSAELDSIILLLARLSLRQLERIGELVRAEKDRKLGNGKAAEAAKEATP